MRRHRKQSFWYENSLDIIHRDNSQARNSYNSRILANLEATPVQNVPAFLTRTNAYVALRTASRKAAHMIASFEQFH